MFRHVLHLSYRDYSSVPEELRCADSDEIEEIYLKQNLIRYIPDWFVAEMRNLRFLCLAGNVIDTVPAQIGQLAALETLDLSDNSLQQLPPQLGQLERLINLQLDGNILSQLPAEIGNLYNLEVLCVRKNRLSRIPIELSQCQALQDLHVDENPDLTDVPTRLFNLPRICYISAECCNLHQLPFIVNDTTVQFLRLFVNNTSLKHCPGALERHNPPGFEPSSVRTRCLGGEQFVIHSPPGLVCLCDRRSATQSPCTLLEASLRACTRYQFRAASLAELGLPRTICERLLYGPVARCASAPCRTDVFTEGIFMLFRRKTYFRHFPMSELFCSKLCADRWLQYHCDTFDELPWVLAARGGPF